MSDNGVSLAKNKIIRQCDGWIAFAGAQSKGKKNDYVAHHAFLDCILSRHEQNSEVNFDMLKYILVHADNFPTQHKCRQNFNLNEKASTKHSITIIYKFDQKHGFKGPQDGSLKLIKNAISKLEHKCIRAANASDCHRLLAPELSKDNTDNTIWAQCNATKSSNMLQKTTWTTDRTFVALGTESIDKHIHLTSSPSSSKS